MWNCAAMVIWTAAYVGYDRLYDKYRPAGEDSPFTPFDQITNPNFAMPELPDDTLVE